MSTASSSGYQLTTLPTAGRYRYDLASATWKHTVRHQFDVASSTWKSYPYGDDIIPATSPTAMPLGDLPGFTMIYQEDYLTSFAQGDGTGLGIMDLYPGHVALDGTQDASGNGWFDKSNKTVYVANSCLVLNPHWDTTLARAAVAYVIPGGNTNNQLYGKWTWRMSAPSGPNVTQYKVSPLLWPGSGVTGDGQWDFPENAIGSTADIQINAHTATVAAAGTPNTTTAPGQNVTDWHIYDLEWTPTSAKFSIDGVVYRTVLSTSIAWPKGAMRFGFKVECTNTTVGSAAPATTSMGNVYIDWVKQYAYQDGNMPLGTVVANNQVWKQIFREDFTTPLSLGAFTPNTTGTGTGGTGYLTTGGAAAPYGSKITVYPTGWAASNSGVSRPEKVLTVANSWLTYNFSVDATTSEAMAATVHFLIGSNGYHVDPTVGGRFAFKFKLVNAPALVHWGAVSQLIASTTDWNLMHGELDINEGPLYGYAPGGMATNWHPYQTANASAQWFNGDWGNNVEHISIVEWVPVGNAHEPNGRETVWIDGVKVGETVGDRVAQNNRAFFAFQTGVNAPPPAADGVTYPADGTVRGQLMVDWVVAYIPT